jgi:hypothetical protein
MATPGGGPAISLANAEEVGTVIIPPPKRDGMDVTASAALARTTRRLSDSGNDVVEQSPCSK